METVDILEIIAVVLALLLAIIGHEIMHGYVAYRYGDTTAKGQGRLSINPLVHIDPVGTVVVPAILYISGASFMFGWAKPVPIFVPTVIRNGGYKAAIFVSLAGIAYNFTLALICLGLFHLFFPSEIESYTAYFIAYFLVQSIKYNIVLGLFNLYPIPPLDGSHALTYLALIFGWHKVVAAYDAMERYGMVILLVCIATPLSHYFFAPIRFVMEYVF
jgi:Zn-dependent protease